MGLNKEMAERAEEIAEKISKKTGLPAELCLGQAYQQILAEMKESTEEIWQNCTAAVNVETEESDLSD